MTVHTLWNGLHDFFVFLHVPRKGKIVVACPQLVQALRDVVLFVGLFGPVEKSISLQCYSCACGYVYFIAMLLLLCLLTCDQ